MNVEMGSLNLQVGTLNVEGIIIIICTWKADNYFHGIKVIEEAAVIALGELINS